MNADQLFALATKYAEDSSRAARVRAMAALSDNDPRRAEDRTAATRIDQRAREHRDALRAGLHQAIHGTVRAVPTMRLPLCTHQRGTVEVCATSDDGLRSVRIRYTPDQALTVGTALIAWAVTSDSDAEIDHAGLLGAVPPDPSDNAPTLRPSVPRQGRRA
jgi:hypothetical protein